MKQFLYITILFYQLLQKRTLCEISLRVIKVNLRVQRNIYYKRNMRKTRLVFLAFYDASLWLSTVL